jgi:hypothetical protein
MLDYYGIEKCIFPSLSFSAESRISLSNGYHNMGEHICALWLMTPQGVFISTLLLWLTALQGAESS